jgi:hypothetical protein
MWNLLIYGVGGFFILWHSTEYFAHRFLLHREVLLKENEEVGPDRLMQLFSAHLHHHVFINQWYRIVQHHKVYQILVPFFLLLFNICLPYEIAFMTVAGFVAGSLAYDGMHLAFHFAGDYNPWFVPWF